MSSPVESPVVGTVWKIEKEVGHAVGIGDVVMILESMKMEIPVEAEDAGVIENIAVVEGDSVGEGDTLATIG
ncbi:MAG: acetyl-CoA carboxylase biotin carboxyl carrier protein subunit [Acidimicrobiaceae bacterium]|nr:acetyl-CoA carboxylase biotin carboxyl carrier protein subunit [Acidimicrobiaceae bacterium]MBT5579059.1 acetyl-CoA carboxylase biotin carboxyl carrier protein subunit [Acidimicrobiaceae bacterium]MBT5849151.1 acetyl-CoA carboxylase biotin carboxyl carrier protein subunit [Acidimicrobiaceae bacterium]